MTELDKWAEVYEQAGLLFEFGEWLEVREKVSFPDRLVYRFFDINFFKLEEERAALLKQVQEQANG